jgi:hypothetical protein
MLSKQIMRLLLFVTVVITLIGVGSTDDIDTCGLLEGANVESINVGTVKDVSGYIDMIIHIELSSTTDLPNYLDWIPAVIILKYLKKQPKLDMQLDQHYHQQSHTLVSSI